MRTSVEALPWTSARCASSGERAESCACARITPEASRACRCSYKAMKRALVSTSGDALPRTLARAASATELLAIAKPAALPPTGA